jgi:hypothetical protein
MSIENQEDFFFLEGCYACLSVGWKGYERGREATRRIWLGVFALIAEGLFLFQVSRCRSVGCWMRGDVFCFLVGVVLGFLVGGGSLYIRA